MTSLPMSLPNTVKYLQFKEKDITVQRYINIELLSKNLWINSLFCFFTDITNQLPINFIVFVILWKKHFSGYLCKVPPDLLGTQTPRK